MNIISAVVSLIVDVDVKSCKGTATYYFSSLSAKSPQTSVLSGNQSGAVDAGSDEMEEISANNLIEELAPEVATISVAEDRSHSPAEEINSGGEVMQDSTEEKESEVFVLAVCSIPKVLSITVDGQYVSPNDVIGVKKPDSVPVQSTAQAIQDILCSSLEARRTMGDLQIKILKGEQDSTTVSISFVHPQGAWFVGDEFVFSNMDGDISWLFPIPVSLTTSTSTVVFNKTISPIDIRCDVATQRPGVSFSGGTIQITGGPMYSTLGTLYTKANQGSTPVPTEGKAEPVELQVKTGDPVSFGVPTRRFSSTLIDEASEHYLPLFGLVAGAFIMDKIQVYEQSVFLIIPDSYIEVLGKTKLALSSIPANLALIARLLPGVKIGALIVAFVRGVQTPQTCENILFLPSMLLDYAAAPAHSFYNQKYLQFTLARALVQQLYRARLRPESIADVGACMLLEGMLEGYLFARLFGDEEAKVLAKEYASMAITLDDSICPPIIVPPTKAVQLYKGYDVFEPSLVPKLDTELYSVLACKARALAASMGGLCSERVADSILVNTARTGTPIRGANILAELPPSSSTVQMFTTLWTINLLGTALYDNDVNVAIKSVGKPNDIPPLVVRYYDKETYFREMAPSTPVVFCVSFKQIVSYGEATGAQAVQGVPNISRPHAMGWVTIDPTEQYTCVTCRVKQPVSALLNGLFGEESLLARLGFARDLMLAKAGDVGKFDVVARLVKESSPARLRETLVQLLAMHATARDGREALDAFIGVENMPRPELQTASDAQLKKALQTWRSFVRSDEPLKHSPSAVLGRAASKLEPSGLKTFLINLHNLCVHEKQYPVPGHTLLIAIAASLVKMCLISLRTDRRQAVEIARSNSFHHLLLRIGEDDTTSGMLHMRACVLPLIAVLASVCPECYAEDCLYPLENGIDRALRAGTEQLFPEYELCFGAPATLQHGEDMSGDTRGKIVLLFLKIVVLYCSMNLYDLAITAANCVEFLMSSASLPEGKPKSGRRTVPIFIFRAFYNALVAATGDPAEPLASFTHSGLGVFLGLTGYKDGVVPCLPCLSGGCCHPHRDQAKTIAFHLLPPKASKPLTPLVLSEVRKLAAAEVVPRSIASEGDHLDTPTAIARTIIMLATSSLSSLLPNPFALRTTLLRSLVYPYGDVPEFTAEEAKNEARILFNDHEPPQMAQWSASKPHVPACTFVLTFCEDPLLVFPASSVVLDNAV